VTNVLDPGHQKVIDDAVRTCDDAENQLRALRTNHSDTQA